MKGGENFMWENINDYSGYHLIKLTWNYYEVINVGMFLQDYKDQLTQNNLEEAEKLLKKAIDVFNFDSIYLEFGIATLIVEDVDAAVKVLHDIKWIKEQI